MTAEELVWLSTSTIGLLAAVLGVIESHRDQVALRGEPVDGRHLIASQALFRYVLRSIIGASWVAATAFREYAVLLLILANVCLTLSSASDLYVGAVLRRLYRKE